MPSRCGVFEAGGCMLALSRKDVINPGDGRGIGQGGGDCSQGARGRRPTGYGRPYRWGTDPGRPGQIGCSPSAAGQLQAQALGRQHNAHDQPSGRPLVGGSSGSPPLAGSGPRASLETWRRAFLAARSVSIECAVGHRTASAVPDLMELHSVQCVGEASSGTTASAAHGPEMSRQPARNGRGDRNGRRAAADRCLLRVGPPASSVRWARPGSASR